MVERRGVHGGLFIGVERLHQIDLDLVRTDPDAADVLIDVLALGNEVAGDLRPSTSTQSLRSRCLSGPPMAIC